MQLVPVSGAAEDCSPWFSFKCKLSYGVRMHQQLCARKNKNKTTTKTGPQALAAKPLFGHTKFLHTLVATVSAAVSGMLCLNQVKRPQFPARDNEVVGERGGELREAGWKHG